MEGKNKECSVASGASDDKQTGYVYILTNPSFKEDWVKIGKSSRPVDVRSKELDNTAVPLPFEIYATMRTAKYCEVEKIIHKNIDRLTDLRIRQNREFFNVSPEQAFDILKDQGIITDDAELCLYKNNKVVATYVYDRKSRQYVSVGGPKEGSGGGKGLKDGPFGVTKRPHRGRFKFSMIGVKIGETVRFDPLALDVTVAADDAVEYDGRIYKLSPFTGTFLPEERRNRSGAYQGAKYFSYRGRCLADLRDEAEGRKAGRRKKSAGVG